ncbi:hypothetical protein Emed_005387 [Eimeria media]
MYPKFSKCRFAQTEVVYLGFSVGANGVRPSTDMVKDIVHWPKKLENATQVQQFMSLVGYVRMFMGTRFADMAKPLYELTQKNVPFVWTDEHTKAVQHLKKRLVNYTLPQLPDPTKPYVLWTDASVHSVGAVLLQDGKRLGFLSKKMNPQQQRYSTYQQELLALLTALKKWEHLLRPEYPGLTVSYKPGKDNVAADALSRNPLHQPALAAKDSVTPARDADIPYMPAVAAPAILATLQARASRSGRPIRLRRRVADPLADPLLYELDNPEDERPRQRGPAHPQATVANSSAKPSQPPLSIPPDLPPATADYTHQQQVSESSPQSPEAEELIESSPDCAAPQQRPSIRVHCLSPDTHGSTDSPKAQVRDTADLRRGALGPGLVPGTPQWAEAFRACPAYSEVFLAAEQQSPAHVRMAAKSPDPDITYPARVYRVQHGILQAYINGIWRIIVPNQLSTRMDLLYRFHDHPTAGHMHSKPVCKKPAGLLHSLAIPANRWDSISMDFITGLPMTSNGNDAILVVVDRLSKMAHFIPLPVTATAQDVATLFIREIVRLHDPALPRQQQWEPIQRDGHLEFEVAAILDVRGNRQQREYLIHWKGKPKEEATWEPAANLTHCKHLLRAFHTTRNRTQPRADPVHTPLRREGRRCRYRPT